jgi:hypothetical protein
LITGLPSFLTIVVADFHEQNGVVEGLSTIKICCKTVVYKMRKGNTITIEMLVVIFKTPWEEPRISILIIGTLYPASVVFLVDKFYLKPVACSACKTFTRVEDVV